MRVVIQRVSRASVSIDNAVHGEIGRGYMLLVSFHDEDNENVVCKMADKISNLRIFEDENGKMNLNLKQVHGAVLSISQFTLYADCHKGNRPSFNGSGDPAHAKKLYAFFNQKMRERGFDVQEGIFGADMQVSLVNDGPVTILLDSDVVIRRKG
ncbi:MAG: D-aminoacyl-tRNA deacylase [Erysipelotrichaceae bacterium]|nr:D-aminoacyl-tRNA deacylase [Erysipelotrichaceae bacterium]